MRSAVTIVLGIALAAALVAFAWASHGRDSAKSGERTAKRRLRDAYVREADAKHDSFAALTALALDRQIGDTPDNDVTRAFLETNFASRAGDTSFTVRTVPDLLLFSPEVAPHVFAATKGHEFATYDDAWGNGLQQGLSGMLEEAWPDDPNMRVAVFSNQISLTDFKGYSRKTIALTSSIVDRAPHHLLLSQNTGKLVVLDQRTGDLREVGELSTPASLSPDGNRVVGIRDKKVAVVDLASGKSVVLDANPTAPFVATKDSVFAVNGDVVDVWRDGRKSTSYQKRDHWNALYRSRDGSRILVTASSGTGVLLTSDLVVEVGEIDARSKITSAAFSDDGMHLAVGTEDGNVFLYSCVNGAFEEELAPHAKAVRAVAIARDNKHVASAGDDSVLRVSPLGKRRLVRATGMPYLPLDLADGHHLVTASEDSVGLAGLDGAPDVRFEYPKMPSLGVAIDPTGTTLVAYPFSRAEGGRARVFDAKTGAKRFEVDTPEGASALVAPGGQHVVIAADKGDATLWEVATGKSIATLSNGYTGAFTHDGKRLAIYTKDELTIWDDAGKKIVSKPGTWPPYAFAANDERLLVNRYEEGTSTTYIFDAKTLAEIAKLKSSLRRPEDLIVIGDIVAIRTEDGTAIVDAKTGQTLQKHVGWRDRGGLTSDGKRLLLLDSLTPRLVEASTGKEIAAFYTSEKSSSGALSSDGKYVATGCLDGKVRLWDATNGNLLATISVGRHEIEQLAFTPDSNHLVLAEPWLRRARVFDISMEAHIAFACETWGKRQEVNNNDAKDFCAARKH